MAGAAVQRSAGADQGAVHAPATCVFDIDHIRFVGGVPAGRPLLLGALCAGNRGTFGLVLRLPLPL